MRRLVLSVIALAGLAATIVPPGTAEASGWVGLGTGAPGWAFYAPAPYAAPTIDLTYYRSVFTGGSFGGHSLHHWW